MSEPIERVCPHCQKRFSVPAELTGFSCLYCGKYVSVETKPEFDEALDESVRARLPAAILDYPENYRRIGKADYEAAFAEYAGAQSELLRELDLCASARGSVTPYAAALLDGVESALRNSADFAKKSRRAEKIYAVKVVLALFFTPLAKKLALGCANELCRALREDWLRRFPDEIWTDGDYDEIIAGYRTGRLCFLTTAVCRAEGKPDDCGELCALRAFRDGWLRQSPGGAALIEEYYACAPAVVTAIELCDAPQARYAELRAQMIEPCLRAISRGAYAECRDLYAEAVRTLLARYGISYKNEIIHLDKT